MLLKMMNGVREACHNRNMQHDTILTHATNRSPAAATATCAGQKWLIKMLLKLNFQFNFRANFQLIANKHATADKNSNTDVYKFDLYDCKLCYENLKKISESKK